MMHLQWDVKGHICSWVGQYNQLGKEIVALEGAMWNDMCSQPWGENPNNVLFSCDYNFFHARVFGPTICNGK